MATNAEHPVLQLRAGRVPVIAVVILLTALGAGFLGGRLSVQKTTSSPAYVAVPNLLGLTAHDAETALEHAGFRASIAAQLSATIPQNHVISQQPAAGARLRNGTLVRIIISVGPTRKSAK